jgi:non-ribosomal peptide synthetase component F
VRHARFTLAQVHVDGLELPLLQADLLVVRREESTDLDWELVTTTLPVPALHQRPCRLTMAVLDDGRLLEGDALVVRSDDRRHVFRGAGGLAGLHPSDGLDE